ncbi:hypothetical protein [Oryzifoliimicrobium ureilyticus]|uniref:hypothetical protein n=1 Tax=Oryzifoliimicrobium ureilyticus TaxID=3113724 RepID=UPI0030762AB0
MLLHKFPKSRLMDVNMFWIGKALGPIEAASMRSFLQSGHRVNLFTYGEVEGVPKEVSRHEASALLPWGKARNLRYGKNGSYALAADYFRLKLQREGLGFWSDADMICLRPIALSGDYIAGRQDDEFINNAFFYMDRHHPLLTELLDLFERDDIPEWLRIKAWSRFKIRLHVLAGRPLASMMPWGTHGVTAFTKLSKKLGVEPLAPAAFYPLHYRDAEKLLDPAFDVDSVITPQSYALHLWNEVIKKHPSYSKPPSGSSLDKLLIRFGEETSRNSAIANV